MTDRLDRLRRFAADPLREEADAFLQEVPFGEIAVGCGFITREILAECLEEQRRRREGGEAPHLGRILLSRGHLTLAQFVEIIQRQATGSMTPPVAPRTPAPEKVGKYRIVREIGRGGFGRVYRAFDPDLGRGVAVKLLHETDVDGARRFLRSAQAAARLFHPHIVPVHEVGEFEGRPFLVMEEVEGDSLDRLRLDVRRATECAMQAAGAVHYAHLNGVVHRDLKPANLMLGRDGHVWVTDFGLAREVRPGGTLTISGTVIGTPAYMPPEQASGGVCDAKSDVYSLGASLYELLTGRPPFEGATVLEVLDRLRDRDPVPPRRHNPDVTRDLESVVLKAMEKDPARRYATASELADELGRVLRGEPVRARPNRGWQRLARHVKRHKAASLALAALGVILISAASTLAVMVAGHRRGLAQERELRERREIALHRLAGHRSRIFESKMDLRLRRQPPERGRKGLEEAVRGAAGYVKDWPSDPQGYSVLARGKILLGDIEGAEADLRRALALRPDYSPGWSLLAILRIEEYQRLNYFRQFGGPGGERIDAKLGVLLSEAGKYTMKALEEPEGVSAEKWGLARSREDWVTERLTRAVFLWNQPGGGARAREYLEDGFKEYRSEELANWIGNWSDDAENERWQTTALEIAGGYDKALFDRASPRFRRGDFAGTIVDLNLASELQPGQAEIYINRSAAKLMIQDAPGALQDAEKALSLRAGLPEGYIARGNAWRDCGDRAKAEADYDWALRLAPRHGAALVNRGILRKARGDEAGAMHDFESALLVVEMPEALANRGWLRQLRGDLTGAKADYDRALALRKEYGFAWYLLGTWKVDVKDPAGARAAFDNAIMFQPSLVEGWVDRGTLRQEQGDLAGAIADFDHAIALRQDVPAAYYNRANAHAARDQHALAEKDYSRALELHPGFVEALFNRATVRDPLGDRAGALADFKRALELAPKDWVHRAAAESSIADLQARLKQ